MKQPALGAGIGRSDLAVIAGGLGRRPQGVTGVACRCPFGFPAVIESAPVFDGGTPNPNLLYVTCPTLDKAISRVEAGGGVRHLRASCRQDDELRAFLAEVTKVYRLRRAALSVGGNKNVAADSRLGAGIGGPEDAEKASCLHAYAAALLAVAQGWLEMEGSGAYRAQQTWARLLPPVEECWCRDRRCAKWSVGAKKAVIDVGTISVRLLVAELVDGRPCALVRKAEVTRLGEALVAGGPLNVAAMARTSEAVARFTDEARSHGAESVVLVGTSATREAGDGREFIRLLGKKHGLDARVITGVEEAELGYAGVCLDVPDAVMLDVGGGSTELITRSEDGRLLTQSLPLGASRATDKWVKHDPPSSKEVEAVADEAADQMNGVARDFASQSLACGIVRLAGVAGTVTTLAALSAGLERYDSDALHLRRLSLKEVVAQLTRLMNLTTAQRAELPCVQAGRAPVIVAGAAIVAATMEALGFEEMTVSERDLLDGLVMRG